MNLRHELAHVAVSLPNVPGVRRPSSSTWKRVSAVPEQRVRDHLAPLGEALVQLEVWTRGPLLVITTVEIADYPQGGGAGPQWHASVALRGHRRRPTDAQLLLCRRAFGLVDAEEDNHHPGVARHLWLPIDPARRVGCECKLTEVVVVEPDGYEWTTPADVATEGCRGCEYELLFPLRPCSIHRPSP